MQLSIKWWPAESPVIVFIHNIRFIISQMMCETKNLNPHVQFEKQSNYLKKNQFYSFLLEKSYIFFNVSHWWATNSGTNYTEQHKGNHWLGFF